MVFNILYGLVTVETHNDFFIKVTEFLTVDTEHLLANFSIETPVIFRFYF